MIQKYMKVGNSLFTPGLPFAPPSVKLHPQLPAGPRPTATSDSPTAHLMWHPGHVNGCQIQLGPCHGPTSRLHSAGAACDHRLAWMHYGPVVWKISTALIFWTAFAHPVADASLERFETEAVRSPAPCIHSAFSSSLNSAQFEFCLQPPTALQMALPGPFQETTRVFLVCPTLSLQMDRRAWWRLQGVGCSKLAQD